MKEKGSVKIKTAGMKTLAPRDVKNDENALRAIIPFRGEDCRLRRAFPYYITN
jgi:hypothetical protein